MSLVTDLPPSVLRRAKVTKHGDGPTPVVMVAGLGWLGGGLAGFLGNLYNLKLAGLMSVDFPQHSLYFVQFNNMKLGNSTIPDALTFAGIVGAVLLGPDVTSLSMVLSAILALFVPRNMREGAVAAAVMAVVLLGGLGKAGYMAHLFLFCILRGVQLGLGGDSPYSNNDSSADADVRAVEDVIALARRQKTGKGGKEGGKITLVGYSSGGHLSSLVALAGRGQIQRLCLLSGIYDLLCAEPAPARVWERPMVATMGWFLTQALGLRSAAQLVTRSPVQQLAGVSKDFCPRKGPAEVVLVTAKSELRGLWPESLVFRSWEVFARRWAAAGATVDTKCYPGNHWSVYGSSRAVRTIAAYCFREKLG